jgi:hypothetical protein
MAAMKKIQIYEGDKCFHDGCVSMMICAVGNRQLQPMTKTFTISAMLCEVTIKRSAAAGVSAASVHCILHKHLNMPYLCQH